MIGSPDFKWFGLAWFGGGKRGVWKQFAGCYVFAISHGSRKRQHQHAAQPSFAGATPRPVLSLPCEGTSFRSLGLRCLLGLLQLLQSSGKQNVTHTNYKTKTTQNQPKTPEIPASNKKRQKSKITKCRKTVSYKNAILPRTTQNQAKTREITAFSKT